MKIGQSKFVIAISLMLLSSMLLLCSCSQLFTNPKIKPSDTNISYWVTDELTQEEVDKMNVAPIDNPNSTVYLDPLYQVDKDSEGNNILPEKFVAYLIGEYKKEPEAENFIIRIWINDLDISVYGINLSSSQKEISKNMKKHGFKLNGVGTSGVGEYWLKENISLRVPPFSRVGIEIDCVFHDL